MMKIILFFMLIGLISGLPDFGDRTQDYVECVLECQERYNALLLTYEEELERLILWFDQGIVPEEEFITEKSKLVKLINNRIAPCNVSDSSL